MNRKFLHYPSRDVPLPEVFVTTRPDPVQKSKTTSRQGLSRTHSLSVASGSLRPFRPVSGSNVARGSGVLYLTRGDNVTSLYVCFIRAATFGAAGRSRAAPQNDVLSICDLEDHY